MDGKNRKNKLLNVFLSISPLLLLVLVMYAVLILSATIGLVLAIRQGAGSLEDAVNATEALMKNSSQVTYLNVLTAQSGLLGAQLSQVANQFAIISGTIDLYQALGGGAE